jgi:hypothetical protein
MRKAGPIGAKHSPRIMSYYKQCSLSTKGTANNAYKAGDKEAIAKIVRARDKTHMTLLIDSKDTFMPTVRQLRLAKPRPEVAELCLWLQGYLGRSNGLSAAFDGWRGRGLSMARYLRRRCDRAAGEVKNSPCLCRGSL